MNNRDLAKFENGIWKTLIISTQKMPKMTSAKSLIVISNSDVRSNRSFMKVENDIFEKSDYQGL
ncbi:MAG: hypothetical protein IJT36_05440 [Alphaproteobacteria bacterium]|nr:hypothetical protein [Alphaproteobacteria bacterium]